MDRQDEQDFRDVVVGQWDALLRIAYLLTGDRAEAEHLVQSTLVRVRRTWDRVGSRVAPEVHTRRVLATVHTSVVPLRRRRGAAVPERAPADRHDEVVRAFRQVPSRQQVVLVLRFFEDLDEAEIAATLGVGVGAVRTRVDGGLRRLGSLLLAKSTSEATADQLLRAVFADAVRDLTPSPDPWAGVLQAVAHSRRRRRTVAAAGVAAAVAVTSVVAVAAPPTGVSPPRPAAGARGPAAADGDVTTWPTRGSLAGRADVLAQVREQALLGSGPVLSVPFLGEVDGTTMALVVTQVGRRYQKVRKLVLVAWGSDWWDVSSVDLDVGVSGGPGIPVLSASYWDGEAELKLVVVTASDDVSVDYSPRPEVDAQGAVSRRYTQLPLTDGVGIASLQGAADSAVLRLHRGSEAPAFVPPAVTGARGNQSEPLAEKQRVAPRCARLGVRPGVADLPSDLDWVSYDVANLLGRSRTEVAEVSALACRRAGGTERMIIAVVLADGTSVRGVLDVEVDVDGKVRLGSPALWPVPEGRAATHPTWLALSALPGSPAGDGQDRAVFFVPGGATAELVRRTADGGARQVVSAPLAPDGTGVAAIPVGIDPWGAERDLLALVVRDRAGREISRVPAPARNALWLPQSGPPVPVAVP